MAGFSRSGANARRVEQKYIGNTCVTDRGAFERLDTVRFSVTVSGGVSAEMFFVSDDTGELLSFSMERGEGCFSLALPMSALCGERGDGLFYYKYRVETEWGRFDLVRRADDFSEGYAPASEDAGTFQLMVYRRRTQPPEWLYGGVMYQIFPDRFFSAGENAFRKKDAVLCRGRETFPSRLRDREENKKNNVFFGGDLQGIAAKLDYLVSLGVTCLYLNPIFASPSNHRYDTADYAHVDELLGGEAALAALIRAASARGIGILLDGVFNHTGSDSLYFNAKGTYDTVGAAQSADSPYAAWYSFSQFPARYEAWWGVPTLPRVNADERSYRDFLFGENGIVRRWTRMGIAGWRIDVADELSDDFLSELSAAVREEKPDAAVIGEVWEDATDKVSYGVRRRYLRGGELDSVMNYPMRTAIIEYLVRGDFMTMKHTLETIYGHYPPEAANAAMNILGTHDTERILTALGAEEMPPYEARADHRMAADARVRAEKLLRLAVGIQMTLPGVPCIYYGDEAGMEGGGDPFCRMPFPWGAEDAEITAFCRQMAAVRRREPLFRDGGFTLIHVDADILCFERTGGTEKLAVIVNASADAYEFRSDSAMELMTGVCGSVLDIAPLSVVVMKMPTGADYSAFVKFERTENDICRLLR